MIWEAWFTWVLIMALLALLVVLIIAVSGSSLSVYNSLATNQVFQLTQSAVEVIFEGTNAGGSKLVLRSRSKGSTIVLWNNTDDIVTILNSVQGSDQPTTMGILSDGVLPAYSTTVCFNQNGASSGTGASGSWLCEAPSVFRV